ncbi:helix-turn-helix transcriptional regulator [Natronobacterium texcoconense]|uniref:IclR helix-turn-helix domain-containing protein n=1 Tax=Natronobacterium texcoconense TaxID=1095778 RepID=A0A1H1F3W2_NATTX|nr:helix-turn-helix domain-containing protein [Natronobacterium texcoconense]SDQ95601.1 IclR helix-turn-helix domain-containing protein [Natronobacterium texcoconense]
MSTYFRHSCSVSALTLSTSDGTIAGLDSSIITAPGRDSLLQLGGAPHLAALVGVIGLVLLGGILAIRNRFRGRRSLGSEPETAPDEYMTDRETVRQLIRENGGRMKQSRIVDSVDWSKAKVSRLLTELEEEGQITKLRLGRENLVCLPGNEPTASKPPEQPQNEQ